MVRKNWTRPEIEEAIRLYLITQFGRIHSRNPDIIKLAADLGRTPSALAMKMANFASLDRKLNRQGMSNVSKLDREIWDDFFNHIDEIDSDAIQEIDGFSDGPQLEFEPDLFRVGVDRRSIKTTRDGQGFFRKMILASYDCRCALSGVTHASLLNASHIASWSKNLEQRLNPSNGICLSAIYDRAFDRGLIVFSDNFDVLFSKQIDDHTYKYLKSNSAPRLRMPRRFAPNIELIKEHRLAFARTQQYRD